MQIRIGSEVPATQIPGSYSVEIEVMGGDADHFETFSVSGFNPNDSEDLDLLKNLLELLERTSKAYPNGRGGFDNYCDTVEGFEPWFSDLDLDFAEEEWSFVTGSSEHFKRLLELGTRVDAFRERVQGRKEAAGQEYDFYSSLWPSDPTSPEFNECSYRAHQVFYYDDSLVKHYVEVEL